MKKENLKIKGKNERGITLIALVVTIVVLLILAGISISIVLGEGGIIDSARKAGEATNAAIANEQQMLQNLIDFADEYLSESQNTEGGGTQKPELPTQEIGIVLDKTSEKIGVDKKIKLKVTTNPENADVTWKSSNENIASVTEGTVTGITAGKVTITASINGNDGTRKEAICEIESKSRFSKLFETDADHEGGTARIPEGYAVGISSDINTEENGLVITDEIQTVGSDNYSIGNEFVWVPVENIDDMLMCQKHPTSKINFDEKTGIFTCSEHSEEELTLLAGKLYAKSVADEFGTPNTSYSANSGLREPVILGNQEYGDAAEGQSDRGIEQLKNTVGITVTQDEIDVNDGSEAKAILAKWQAELQDKFNEMAKSVAKYKGFYIGRYETSGLEQNGTPAVKPGISTANTNWYTLYTNSKSIAKAGTKSSMIWGCQWDEVMQWFLKSSDSDTVKYVTDSTGMGWYSDNYKGENDNIETGKELEVDGKVVNRVKNIYDMAGNLNEWTIEATWEVNRVYRGGGVDIDGSSAPACFRNGWGNPFNLVKYFGSRATLYII